MNALAPRIVIVLSLALGGGSLLLFGYFLLSGAPLSLDVVQSNAGRLTWDALLSLLFFVQHSGMVRRGAKERLARYAGARYLPAIYSIASGIALVAVVLLWQPTADVVFGLNGPARWLWWAGFVAAAMAIFAWGVRSLGGFDPFGTLALEATVRGAPAPSSVFVARGPYRYVRHPLYLAVLLLIWSAPRITTDRLLFDVLWTAWIVAATKLEERDLAAEFGATYRAYQASVPMLFPHLRA